MRPPGPDRRQSSIIKLTLLSLHACRNPGSGCFHCPLILVRQHGSSGPGHRGPRWCGSGAQLGWARPGTDRSGSDHDDTPGSHAGSCGKPGAVRTITIRRSHGTRAPDGHDPQWAKSVRIACHFRTVQTDARDFRGPARAQTVGVVKAPKPLGPRLPMLGIQAAARI